VAADLLAIVEAAYAAAETDAEWLKGVALAALPALQRGGGVHAYLVDMNAKERLLREPLLIGATAQWKRTWRETWWDAFMAPMSPAHVRFLHSFTSVSHTTDLFAAAAAEVPTYDEYLSRVAEGHWGESKVLRGARPSDAVELYPDSFNVACIDGEGHGCVLVANMLDPAQGPVAPSIARVWAKVAAHVATGYRLHRKRREASDFDSAEAILDHRGRAVHATGPACHRWALDGIRALASSIDRARTRSVRRNGPGALEAWHALALGRWSILDCFDRDGRRYVIARPNEPRPRASPKLTRRQSQIVEHVALGHSNKLIAYELGLSPSTVASHLALAAGRLGARSRLELILMVRQEASVLHH
jgi:DNA-binding CsgD family transcriptional regulator